MYKIPLFKLNYNNKEKPCLDIVYHGTLTDFNPHNINSPSWFSIEEDQSVKWIYYKYKKNKCEGIKIGYLHKFQLIEKPNLLDINTDSEKSILTINPKKSKTGVCDTTQSKGSSKTIPFFLLWLSHKYIWSISEEDIDEISLEEKLEKQKEKTEKEKQEKNNALKKLRKEEKEKAAAQQKAKEEEIKKNKQIEKKKLAEQKAEKAHQAKLLAQKKAEKEETEKRLVR